VAHLSDGTLRRMFDDPDALTSADRRHYADCTGCQARYAGMAEDARATASMLAAPELELDLGSALKRVQTAPAAKPRFGFGLPILRPASRPMFAGLAAAVVVLALVATAFANILPLFQPKTVQPVPVTVADIEALSALSDYGTVTWSEQPQPHIVLSAAEAQAVAGFKAPAATYVPTGTSKTVTYAAMPKATAVFTFDASKAANTAASTGKSLPKLPKGVDGAKLTVTVGPAILEVYGNLQQKASSDANAGPQDLNVPELVIAESAAPQVTSTQVTAKQLMDYILSIPGLSKDLKAALKAIGDPTTTLIIPVPIQYATSTTVSVQGVNGVAVGDNTGLGSGVIWIKGNVFVVAGPLKQSEVVKIADGLKS
jgi:hypothetical protein